jgi:hypothetical protein
VEGLARGAALEEQVRFPGGECIRYVVEVSAGPAPRASFENGTIRLCAPCDLVRNWANEDIIGMYFDFPANGSSLKVAIEKDLECREAAPGEHDPDAFPRAPKNC